MAMLRGYQRWISPFLGPRCRFYPSCSTYAIEALAAHGLAAGGWLTVRRVLRCQPFCDGGVDLVPPAVGKRRAAEQDASTAATGAPSC